MLKYLNTYFNPNIFPLTWNLKHSYLLLFFIIVSILVKAQNDATEEEMSSLELVLRITAITVLMILSAAFSGLSLGFLSLDIIGLEIVIGAGEVEEATKDEIVQAKYAKKIAPIRKQGNLLLATLVLGNVAVNSMTSILLADLTDGLVGFFVSTVVIVVFGEILPQAICSRHALFVGSKSIPLVKVIIIAFYIVAKPISMILDKMLGEEIGTIHSKRELHKMLEIYIRKRAIDPDEGDIMYGAISYKDKSVSSIMTPIDKIYMLPINATVKLDFKTIRDIFKSGFSRIPVWGKDQNDIVGLMFVKDLIFIDPEDETQLLNFIHIFGRGAHRVWSDSKLGDVLKIFKMGKGHLALVYDVNNDGPGDPFYELKGLATLEDVIEEIIQDEIMDEADVFESAEKTRRVSREGFDYARLRLLDSRFIDSTLSKDEILEVAVHLSKNYPQFSTTDKNGNPVSESLLCDMLSKCPVLDYGKDCVIVGDTLYTRNVATAFCTVIMQGKIEIKAGREGFVSEAGPWFVLAADSLVVEEGAYVPDFTAKAIEKSRCLRIPRFEFQRLKNDIFLTEKSIKSST